MSNGHNPVKPTTQAAKYYKSLSLLFPLPLLPRERLEASPANPHFRIFCTGVSEESEFTKPRQHRHGNYVSILLMFQNFRFKRFLIFRWNLLPWRVSEVFLFNFTTFKTHFWHPFPADLGLRSKTQSFLMFVVKVKLVFRHL